MNRKRIILILLVVLLVGSVIIAIVLTLKSKQTTTSDSSNQNAIIKTDPDTGETITNDPALGKSESQDASSITILGLADLIDAVSLSSQQSDFIKAQLMTYDTANLKNKYSTLTIQPQNTTINGDTVTSTIRLGDGDTTVSMRFESGNHSGTMQLFVTDPNNTGGGNYSSQTEALNYE